jgi:thiol-disulfide isomerase/thioredoxin
MRGGLAAALVFACFGCAHERVAIQGPDGNLALRTLDGQDVKLAQLGKRVTVIALWGTFCEPCLEELPQLNRLAESYRGDRDVAVIAVAIDDDVESVRKMAERLHLTIPVLIDSNGALSQRLQPNPEQQVLPLTAVIAADFAIDRNIGYRPMSIEEFISEGRARVERARKVRPAPR